MSKKTILFGAIICSLAFTACNNDSTSEADKMKADSTRRVDSLKKAIAREDSIKKANMPKEPMDTNVKDKKPIIPSGKPTGDPTAPK